MSVTEQQVMDALSTVNDPEVSLNIVDLGLIYDVKINEDNEVHVVMTLTMTGCPLGQTLAQGAESAIMGIDGVKDVLIEVTFEPSWNANMMSDFAKEKLGIG